MFADNHDIRVMFEEYFVLKKKKISPLPISRLMEAVKVKSVSLNVYYMVGDFGKKIEKEKAENHGNTFLILLITHSVFMFCIWRTFLRIYLNLVNPINELIIENYLSENGSVVKNVKKMKEKITKKVFDCLVDVGKNLMIYLNVVLDNVVFEHIFLTFNPDVDYNSDSLKILNHEGVLSLHKGSNSGNVSS